MPLTFEDPSIVFHVNKGMILEASAGSGKTTILTERWLSSFLYLLVWEEKTITEALHGIVALTFTKKAASEMKHRIRQRFDELWEENELPYFLEQIKNHVGEYPQPIEQIITRLNSQKNTIDDLFSSAKIMTINAFVFYLLRAHPLELSKDIGLNPEESGYDISVSEKETQIELIRKLIMGDFPNLQNHFKLGVQLLGLNLWLKFFEQIRYLISRYGEAAILGGLDLQLQDEVNKCFINNDKALEQIYSLIKPYIDRLISSLDQENTKKSLPKDSANLYKVLSECEPDNLLSLFTKEVQYKLPKPLKDEELNSLREVCYENYQRLIDRLYEVTLPIMLPISEQCTKELKKYQSEQGEISFGDSEIVLLDLLSNSQLLKKVQSHLRFFFADEYQDTSDLQKKLFDMLIETDKITPFFVGDPKQSIYSFRNANVYIFDQTVQEFKSRSYEHKFLNTNYRSAGDHVNLVNFLFRDIFINSPLNYQDQIANNANKGQFSYTLALGLDSEEKYKTQEKLQYAYHEALFFIQELLEKGVSPGEVMVLFRNRMSILEFYRFAKEYDPQLPLSSSVKNVLWDSEYISPLMSFLKVLLLYHHDLSVIELLKTPIFRKSDIEINQLLLKAKATKQSLFSVLGEEKTIIEEFLVLRDRIPLEELLSLLIKELHYEEYLDLLSETGEARATLSLFLEEAQQLQEKKEITLSDFVNIIENRKNTTEEAEFSGEEGKTLRLMTIHSSKGLESPYVIYVHKPKSKEETTKYPLYQHNRVAFDIFGKGIIANQLGEIYLNEYVEEEKRLAYVACTRAKNQFIFCALPTLVRSSSSLFTTQWESFINKELIEKESFYASQKRELLEVVDKKSSVDLVEDLSKYYEQYKWIQQNDKEFTELPQFLSVSLLLDAEFNPEKFQDKYLRRSFDLVDSLRELAEEEFTLQSPSQQDIGSLVHKVLQEFDAATREEVLEYLDIYFPEYQAAFNLVLDYVYGYWESTFYKELSSNSDALEKERQVLYLLPNDIMIRAVADLYTSSSKSKNTIVDYKLSIGKNMDRYHRQLSYYALLSEKSDQAVDEIVLFSLKEAKAYPLKWDRELTEKCFAEAVRKSMEMLTGKQDNSPKQVNPPKVEVVEEFKDTLF